MLTYDDIEMLVDTANHIHLNGPVHKNACTTDTLIYLRCLTDLGILQRVETDNNITYWEYAKCKD